MGCWTDPQCLLFFGSAAFVSIAISIFIGIKARTSPYPKIIRHKKEKYFQDSKDGTDQLFPSLHEEPTIGLSVIVPAYNEEDRLPAMMDECMVYLEKRLEQDKTFQYEVIIVSDGSKDGTVSVAQKYAEKYSSNKIRVLALTENRGKGGAVRLGMLSARGQQLLFADADGATKFSDLDKLDTEMQALTSNWQDPAIVIGSRAHLEEEAIASRSIFRTILMHGFHFLVWLFAVRGIKDTQCGFKLFTRSAAQQLFQLMHVERWSFDVEVLFLAQALRLPIREVGVHWTEIDGSKITPVWTWIQMGMDLFLIWFRYAIGAWRFDAIESKKLHSN